ncbi:hypothetical protein [Streptomyces sp. NBC_01750]|uniref:hypothetical protein n=1 Tax=Streptomyces sp. NBC_01750 TaxID=2975928 RepID=UPI002DD80B88|nr:hypothetical protein [Streptomyces sp. NBC_01750]WSD30577.1 hypothetical protein OG966_00410 [Streptomyces sp. NBC_01750]
MRHHALEITLTRQATRAELARAVRVMPLAANHDRTRLMTLAKAKNPDRALSRVHHRLAGLLPVDVVATHYPDADHCVTLAVDFSPDTDSVIRRAAKQAGQSPSAFVEQSIHRALARHARQEAEHLDHALQVLLARTTPARLLAAAGRALAPTPAGT